MQNGLASRQGDFNVRKSVAAIAFLVARTGETLYPILKMLYVADKMHLEQFGRFIVGDTYCALKKGPVPSATYDMLKYLRGERKFFAGGEFAQKFLSLDASSHRFAVQGSTPVEDLSRSDIECLEQVIGIWKDKGSKHIADLSHDDAWRATVPNGPIALETIAAQFEHGAALVQHLSDRHPG